MQDVGGCDGKANLPHTDDRVMAAEPQDNTQSPDSEGDDEAEDQLEDSPSIQVGTSEVVPFGVEPDHDEGLEVRDEFVWCRVSLSQTVSSRPLVY